MSGGVDIEIGLPSLPAFSGGITNSGTMTASGAYAIQTGVISTFSGGITNNGGLITAKTAAIDLFFDTTTFTGGIVNTSGTISGGLNAIVISTPTFTNGLTNGGTITSAGPNGKAAISIGGFSSVVSFGANAPGGGIVNTGTITGGSVGRVRGAANVLRRHH